MEVLLLVLGVVLVTFLMTLGTLWLLVRGLHRRNRVTPTEHSDAPLTWLASPGGCARLHRRLRASASVADLVAQRNAGDAGAPIVGLAHELRAEAVALDHHLAAVALLPPRPRRSMLQAIAAQVGQVEHASQRLIALESSQRTLPRRTVDGSAMEDLSRRLDALDQARAELRAIERDAGLTSPG